MKVINSAVNDLGLKNNPQQNLSVQKNKNQTLVNEVVDEEKSIEIGLKKIVNKLLDAIKSNKDLANLSQSMKNIVISKNIANDLSELKQILNKDEKLKIFIPKLEKLLDNNLGELKSFSKAIDNSGVFLESKLKANLNKELLPDSFFRLVANTRNLKTKELKSEILKMDTNETNAKKALEKLENFIDLKIKNSDKKISQNLKFLDFLNNARAFLQKNENPLKIFQIACKIEENLNKNIKNLLLAEVKNDDLKSVIPKISSLKANIENIKSILKGVENTSINSNSKDFLIKNLTDFKDFLSKNLQNLNQEIKENNSQINKDSLNNLKIEQNILKTEQNDENMTNFLEQKPKNNPIQEKIAQTEQKMLEKITKSQDISQEIKQLSTEIKAQNLQNQALNNILNNENLSLQNKIQSLTRLLSENLKNEISTYTELKELKNTKKYIKIAKKDALDIKLRTSEDIKKAISNDAKNVLSQLSKASANSENKAAFNLSQKILNQIELNQLTSVANNEINTYLPYIIDGLDESSISFKNLSDDKFFAQIKLKFKKIGGVNIMLGLSKDKYLDINMMIENDAFRQILIKNAREFKKNLRKVGLISSNFFISKLTNFAYEEKENINLGFEKKV